MCEEESRKFTFPILRGASRLFPGHHQNFCFNFSYLYLFFCIFVQIHFPFSLILNIFKVGVFGCLNVIAFH